MAGEAKVLYEQAAVDLVAWTRAVAHLECEIDTSSFPLEVRIRDEPQQLSINDETGEVMPSRKLVIRCGLDTVVESSLQFELDSATLKKIISKSAKLGDIYYKAFREQRGALI